MIRTRPLTQFHPGLPLPRVQKDAEKETKVRLTVVLLGMKHFGILLSNQRHNMSLHAVFLPLTLM